MTSSATVSPNKDEAQTFNNGTKPKTCLKLKGSLVPMTVLELTHYDGLKIDQELHAKITQAPGFFENLPIIIDLEKLDEHEDVPFKTLVEQCLAFSIKVVAIRGGNDRHQHAAKEAGLGLLAKQKDRSNETIQTIEQNSTNNQSNDIQEPEIKEVVRTEIETVEVIKTVVKNERQQSKIIHQPVRSGQQVYAADGDLIILASVSAGAEILADGNIHVYGALRGRALAGVKGDTSARIFCHSLEAELVSVAGQYKISEDIDKSVIKKSTQVYLDNDTLSFKELEM